MHPFIPLVACLVAVGICVQASAQVPTKRFDNSELHYAVQLPASCRHMLGAGTLEAICAPDLDPAAAETIATAGALLFEVDAEAAPADAAAYSETEFRAELPAGVCGESDASQVRLTDVSERKTENRTVFSAGVTCPAVGFLQLPERQARAQVIVIEEFRYRLLARWPIGASDVAKPLADAFFASFTSTAASK